MIFKKGKKNLGEEKIENSVIQKDKPKSFKAKGIKKFLEIFSWPLKVFKYFLSVFLIIIKIIKYSFLIFWVFCFLSIYLIISGKEFDVGSRGDLNAKNVLENKILSFSQEKEFFVTESEFAYFLEEQIKSDKELKNKISNIRVDFEKNNIKIAGVFKKGLLNKDIPFLISFKLKKEDNQIKLIPSSFFKIGRLSLPSSILDGLWLEIENLFNEELPSEFLKDIKEIKLEKDKLIFTF